MVDAIASSPSIDLSGLPPPDIIAQPTFEVRLAAKLAGLIAAYPAFSALVESDPAMKLLESDTYDEMVLTAAMNDAAKGMLLAFATGPQLDHIAALFEVTRLTGESDTALRQRVQLAPHSFSVAGPELAYVYWARTADADVADATATSPSPGQVTVTLLSASAADGVPAADVVSAVQAVLNGPVRPLTDLVTVQAPTVLNYSIAAQLWIFAGPDEDLILTTAQESLSAYLASARKLGRDISPSAIIAALHVANVQRVVLSSPAAPVAIDDGQLAHPDTVSVTIAGTVA